MPTDDLKSHANSSYDFYELLGITFETSETDIRRAYRRTALKYHPDKNAGNPAAVEKFHLLQIAYDVLSDPGVKALYDNARRARKDKEQRDATFEGKRRKMKEDLERRESGFLKRKREEDDLDREIQRLAEDGRRRRKERAEMLNRERLEEEERLDQEANNGTSTGQQEPFKGGTEVEEIDRTVKVRWAKDGIGAQIDKDSLSTLFARFGSVENVVLQEKRQRLGDRKEKVLVTTGLVVYSSVVGAHAAVLDAQKQSEPEFQGFESVFWASNKEPEFLQTARPTSAGPESTAATATPSGTPKVRSRHDIPGLDTPTKTGTNGHGLKKAPSFASFSPAGPKTSQGTPQGGASLEEMTMIRLKNAERKRLEEQIRRNEEEAAKAEGS